MKQKGFPGFFEALNYYEWLGNVRELIHTMELAFTVARFDLLLFSRHLPMKIRIHQVRKLVDNRQAPYDHQASSQQYEEMPSLQAVREAVVSEVEKRYLEDLMKKTNGNIKDATRISGLSQSRLYALIKKYHILRK
ncbi:MAG: helix-turn-helix domain-containing protein [Desulfobacterales bacterium]